MLTERCEPDTLLLTSAIDARTASELGEVNLHMSTESTLNLPEKASSTAVAPSEPARAATTLPQWKVLLHNDPVSDMDYVVESIVRFVRATVPMATRCMFEAHRKGISLITVTHREHAELLQEQFQSARLRVTIEPDAR